MSENGEAETAYKLAVQDTYPSWGCWIANGATTLLENWDLNATRDISDNHMMFGEDVYKRQMYIVRQLSPGFMIRII